MAAMDIFFSLGGMFVSSFLAATILPLSSEVVMGYLLVNNYNTAEVIAIATLGNVLGSLVNYWMGFVGSHWLMTKIFRVSELEIDRARNRFQTHGTASLLLAWVPGIGDPLTVVAGMLRVNIWVFLVLVTTGKLGRYLVVAGAVLSF